MKKSNYIGIKLYNGTFLPILKSNEIKTKKVILTTVKDNQKKTVIELYEGSSNNCIENEYLGKLTIPINRQTKKGDPAIEVHLRLSDNNILYAEALDSESGEKSGIEIEHTVLKTILPETGDIKNQVYDENIAKVQAFSDIYKKDLLKRILIILGIILLVAILSFLIFLGIKGLTNHFKEKNKIETTTPPVKKVEPQQEITGVKKLEGTKHFIRKGDNLWNICKKYYDDPWYYPDLAKQNNIKNPRLIFAGTYIIIPNKNSLQRFK